MEVLLIMFIAVYVGGVALTLIAMYTLDDEETINTKNELEKKRLFIVTAIVLGLCWPAVACVAIRDWDE